MDFFQAFWHLLNFVAPAIGTGLLASSLAKVLWRQPLRRVSWLALAAWAVPAGMLALVAGLLWEGRDGRISTYALLVAATAVALWWRGLRHAG